MGEAAANYRQAGRVVVVDERGRVLLFRVADPRDDRPAIWITPGGGVEPGERPVDAAVRELAEETGLRVSTEDLGSPVATCGGEWVFRGTPYRSDDVFFGLRTVAFDPDDSGWTALEHEVHDGWRWCETGELERLDGQVLPSGLAGVVAEIVAGRRPGVPVSLPWRTV